MRRNVVILVVVLLLITVAYFFLVFSPQSSRIREASEAADAEEMRVQQLQTELSRLQALERNAAELRQQAAQFELAMPGDPRLAEFILQVQDAANASGIDWVSVNPAVPQPGDQPGVLEVQIGMNLTGGYFQVQDFLVRMETLPRVVKVGQISLAIGEAGVGTLTASLQMKMFVAGAVPAPETPVETPPEESP